jgi:hypothetical protein
MTVSQQPPPTYETFDHEAHAASRGARTIEMAAHPDVQRHILEALVLAAAAITAIVAIFS